MNDTLRHRRGNRGSSGSSCFRNKIIGVALPQGPDPIVHCTYFFSKNTHCIKLYFEFDCFSPFFASPTQKSVQFLLPQLKNCSHAYALRTGADCSVMFLKVVPWFSFPWHYGWHTSCHITHMLRGPCGFTTVLILSLHGMGGCGCGSLKCQRGCRLYLMDAHYHVFVQYTNVCLTTAPTNCDLC